MDKIMSVTLILFVVFAFVSFIMYIPRMIAWFGAIRPQKRIKNEKNDKIAIVVPARNESVVIKSLLDSIEKQTYKKSNYDLYVVVKDENDPTIKMVSEYGGTTFICSKQKCKGDALNYAFKRIIEDDKLKALYRGIVVVDADCVLDVHFLEEMNNSFVSNCQVMQAKKNVKNYLYKDANSLASCCNGLIWTLIDDMGNRYKSDHNITNMIIGTGFMLDINLVKEMGGWPYTETVTEDMEFMNDCVVKNISTYYNSYAVIYVEEAKSLNMTNKRRFRWMKGLIDSERIYAQKVDSLEGKMNRRNKYFIRTTNIVYRYIGSAVFFSLLNICYAIYLYFTKNPLLITAIMYVVLGFLVIYFSFFFMTLVCLICDHKNIKLSFLKKIGLLVIHPFFYMGYIHIVSKALCTKTCDKWEAIERIECNNNV